MIQWTGSEHAEGSDLWPRRTVIERILDWVADDPSPAVAIWFLLIPALALGVFGFALLGMWLR